MNPTVNSMSLEKNTRFRIVLLVVILCLGSVSSLWILHGIEETKRHESHILNEAGKLSTLTQKAIRALAPSPSSSSIEGLEKAKKSVESIQAELKQAEGIKFNQLIDKLYLRSPQALSTKLIATIESGISSLQNNASSTELTKIQVELDSLFEQLNNAVVQVEEFIIDRNSTTSNIIAFFILLSFALALLVMICIFRPINKALSQYARDTSRLLAIVGSVTECIKSVDKNFTLCSMNSAGLKLVGVDSIEQVKGMSVLDFILPAYHAQFKEAVSRVFEGETVDLEFEIVSQDGTRRWMHQMATPYRDPKSGKITEMVAVTRDVSKKKDHADTLAKIRRNEITNALSSGIAHDINNILAIVSGNQQLLALKNKDETLFQYIEKIQMAVDRASNLTTKLLKTSKQSPSKMEMVTIEDLFSDLYPLLRESIPNNITLKWEKTENIKEKINKYDLEDAILNLVLNARNAIEHHGTIELKTTIESNINLHDEYFAVKPSKTAEYIKFSVEDNGIGISSDKFEDIFLPFKTFSKTGSGLGLSMVYGFATRYGYGLSLHSTVNEGTCFSIWIPISQDFCPISSPQNVNSVNYNHHTRSLNIVLIDDEVDVLNINKKLLESYSHTVTAFNSAKNAIQYLDSSQTSVDIIITDEVMPGEIQGHDLIRKYQDDYPVILVTGFSETRNISEFEHVVLRKPFSIATLIEKINHTIGASAAA